VFKMIADRSLGRDELFVGDRRFLLSSLQDSLEGERFTDCILVTREGIPVPVHRMVLNSSPFLKTLFISTNCCRGLCSTNTETTILLPDVSYRMLSIILGFFYTGNIRCTPKEMDGVKDLLVNMLQVPKTTVMLEKKDGYTDCVECAEHVPVNSLLEHLVNYHVEEPCVRDMSMVEGGDSRAVSCSQHSGSKACDIDVEKTRINNGIFNYLGQEDPVACVLDHYLIHFNNMVKFVRNQYPGMHIPSHVKFDQVKLRQLATNSSALVLEPNNSWGSTRAGVDKFLHSTTAPYSASTPSRPGTKTSPSPPSATPPTSHSGGLTSPEDLSDTDPIPAGSKLRRKMRSMLSSFSEEEKSDVEKSDEDSFSDPPGGDIINTSINTGSNYFPPSKEPAEDAHKSLNSLGGSNTFISDSGPAGDDSKRKASDDRDDGNILPPTKKARTSAHEQRMCRVCKKSQADFQFEKHLTTHLYELWPEVNRTEEKQQCKKIGCEKQFSNWKVFIQHLATTHGELTKKLAERDETLGEYEMDASLTADSKDDETLVGAVGGIFSLTGASKKGVLESFGKPVDYFDGVSPRREEQLERLNSSQNPLLDSSQEDAMVIVENGDDDIVIDVNELLDDSQDDRDIKTTPPVLTKVEAVSSGLSPIVIDTSQSDSDVVASIQGVTENLNLVIPSPEDRDSEDSDATAPWGDGDDLTNDRIKEVQDD